MTDASSLVEVLGAAWCADTARTARCLRRLRVPFRMRDVDQDLDGVTEVTSVTGGAMRTPVIRIGARVLVEPSNAALVEALEADGRLAPSTVYAFEHGQNVGDVERALRLVGAGVTLAATHGAPWPVRVPLRLAAIGLAWTAVLGWCPVYDAQGLTSVGGPGDHPEEAERDPWWASTRRPAATPEPLS